MKAVLISAVLILIISIIPAVYSQEEDFSEMTEYTKITGLDPLVRNFAGMGHGGSKCIYCHAFLMPDEDYEKKFLKGGCRCHQGDVANGYNVRIDDVREVHDSKHCKLCHAGTKNITYKVYHLKIHKNIPCVKCHRVINGVEFKITKPKTTECKRCHKYDIHFTHSNVLGKVCKLCHGSAFASIYTRKDLESLNLDEKIINKTINEKSPKKEVKEVGFITISKILAFIIDAIF